MVRLRLKEGVALVRDAHQGGPVYLRRQGHPLEVYEDVWGAPEEVQEAWERYLELQALEEEVWWRHKQLKNSAHHFTPTLARLHFSPLHPNKSSQRRDRKPLYSSTGGSCKDLCVRVRV